MSDPFNTPEFKALKKKWDAKLVKSGLENIEQEDGNLKKWSNSLYKNESNPVVIQAKEEYYRLAAQMLHDYPFKNGVERYIWEQHSEGLSIRDIVKKLKKSGAKTHKNKVHRVVQTLVKEMIAKCSKKQT